MRAAFTWLVTAFTLSAVALAVAANEPDPTAVLITGVAVIALAVLVGARHLAVRIVGRTIRVGSRSRQHREALNETAPPPSSQHPGATSHPRARTARGARLVPLTEEPGSDVKLRRTGSSDEHPPSL